MKEKLKELICEIKNDGISMETIDDTMDLVNEVGLDSLQIINLLLKVEEELGVEIDFEEFELDHLKSVHTFATYLSQKSQESCL